LHGCLQAMQWDDERLAHYLFVTHTMRERLAKRGSYVCRQYIEEFDLIEETPCVNSRKLLRFIPAAFGKA